MVKTISKIGNSQGLMFDAALMDMAHLKVGDQVNVEVHEGGTITLTPLDPKPSRAEVSRIIRCLMMKIIGYEMHDSNAVQNLSRITAAAGNLRVGQHRRHERG